MNKTNSFHKYLKNISYSINKLLENYLNKLKSENLINLARSNKTILTFVALLLLFITYLSIPSFFKQNEISNKIKYELLDRLNLDLKFSNKLKYNFFPSPHFTTNDSSIFYNNYEISKAKKIKIYISLENLFSLENIVIDNVIIENANFNLNSKNHFFILDLLNNNYSNINFKIIKSNIFFKNIDNEVLFINKILEMKYYHDPKESKNFLYSKNEIFNFPYEIKINKDKIEKKYISQINLNFIKLKIENEYNYLESPKIGNANLISNNFKNKLEYKISEEFFEFSFFDNISNPSFFYQGYVNRNPFYSNFKGNTEKLNLVHLYDPNAIIAQFLKTELFNSKNIDFELNIDAKSLYKNPNFVNINFNSKIKEGLIDLDNTSFEWKNYVAFKIVDSLIFLKDGELVLDGKLNINVKNYDKIYKYLLTPKKYRKKIKNINFTFSYNFDQKTSIINDIKIDNKTDLNLNNKINKIVLKENILKNKIYLKKILNEVLMTYAG